MGKKESIINELIKETDGDSKASIYPDLAHPPRELGPPLAQMLPLSAAIGMFSLSAACCFTLKLPAAPLRRGVTRGRRPCS